MVKIGFKIMKTIKSIVISIFVVGCLILLYEKLSEVARRYYYELAPIEWFVEYRSVSLVGKAYEGQSLTFISSSNIAAGVHLFWADELLCKAPNSGTFKLYSIQGVDKYYQEAEGYDEQGTKVWMYHSKVPRAGYICVLKYGPKVVLPMKVIRYYPARFTEPFEILEYDGSTNSQ